MRHGAGHHQRRWQKLADHRAMPLLRPPRLEGCALQGAEHEQQRQSRGGRFSRGRVCDFERRTHPGPTPARRSQAAVRYPAPILRMGHLGVGRRMQGQGAGLQLLSFAL